MIVVGTATMALLAVPCTVVALAAALLSHQVVVLERI